MEPIVQNTKDFIVTSSSIPASSSVGESISTSASSDNEYSSEIANFIENLSIIFNKNEIEIEEEQLDEIKEIVVSHVKDTIKNIMSEINTIKCTRCHLYHFSEAYDLNRLGIRLKTCRTCLAQAKLYRQRKKQERSALPTPPTPPTIVEETEDFEEDFEE